MSETAQQKKDKLVSQLFEVLQAKKEEIANIEKPNWVTNCSFPMNKEGGSRINIQTISDQDDLNYAFAHLLGFATFYNEAKSRIGSTGTFKWGGFTVEQWEADFKTRVSKINIATKKKEFADLEARLNGQVSQERRDELEMEALSKALLGKA